MTSHDEQRLSDALRRQAESQDPHLLSLDDVTGRARGIRRRRVATGVVAAVAALGVVVPTALTATGTDRSEAPIATNPPSATAQVTPTDKHLTVPVLGDLPTGDAPRIALRIGSEVLTPEGDRVRVGDDTVYAAVVGDSVVTVEGTAMEEGSFVVRDKDGTMVLGKPASVDGALTVSPDRTAAAYVDPQGRIHTWTEMDGDLTMTGPIDNIQLGPMSGSESCRPTGTASTTGLCTVIFNRGEGGAAYADSEGASEEIPGFIKVTDMSERIYAGQTKSTIDGSCSEIRQVAGGRSLETCDYLLKDLSPDGLYITASSPYGDALCCSTYDVLDASTAKSLITLDARAGQTMTQVLETRWEDDSHLLAVVSDGSEWRVVRIALDGSVELADVGDLPEDTGDGTLPLRLATGR